MMPPTRSGYRATEAIGGGAGWDPANTRASDDLCAPGSWRVPLEQCRRLPPKEGLPDHSKPAAVLVTVKDKSPRDGVCGPPSLTSHCALAATGDG